MRSKDGEVALLGRESSENVRRVDRQRIFAEELFTAKIFRDVFLGGLPIGERDTEGIITRIEGKEIEAVGVEHPDTGVRRILGACIGMVNFWGFVNCEIKGGKSSIRPI